MILHTPLKDITITAFDLETSGAYPVSTDICEFAAVKWRGREIVDTLQILVKPREKMSDFIIGIHGITNEMVADAPSIDQVIHKIHSFLKEDVLVAHHAPFDLGFLAYEFEKKSLMFPKTPVLCSSLLSRKLFPQSENHKLQTLVDFFKLEKGTAHRALDDSKACLQVTLKCIEKFGWEKYFDELVKFQEPRLDWKDFSLHDVQSSSVGNALVVAIDQKKDLEISYRTKGDSRIIKPFGIVRNPSGDYIVAYQPPETQQKRFYLQKIVDARLL